jgi:hypothetical protein
VPFFVGLLKKAVILFVLLDSALSFYILQQVIDIQVTLYSGECPVPIKALCLKMMVLACTGNDNIAQNPFFEFLTQHCL